MVLCTSSDKGPYMSGVWWLNVVRFRRFARAIVRPEKKKNNKDSTEIRKTIKDSNVLESFKYWNLLIIITRMLLLQATVKRFQFDLYVNLEGQQMLISSWFQK